MKLLHTSDLHLGRRMSGYSFIEDQKYILNEIKQIAIESRVDAVLLSGDIYDKPIPSEEAVALFDGFVTDLSEKGIWVMAISGNHDSAERIGFGSEIMKAQNVFFSTPYKGTIHKITREDEFGNINFYLLPFVKPITIRAAHDIAEIKDYTEAIEKVIEKMDINKSERNIILSHQFVAGASTSESETLSVGGLDNVSPRIYGDFDYVALGHIHRPQKIGGENIRYSGSPLKYSFDRNEGEKSIVLVELKEKGNISINKKTLSPLRDMREIKGKFSDLIRLSEENPKTNDDYVSIILTDDLPIRNAFPRLKAYYPNLMMMRYENRITEHNEDLKVKNIDGGTTPLEYCNELFKTQNGCDMTEYQEKVIVELMNQLKEVE